MRSHLSEISTKMPKSSTNSTFLLQNLINVAADEISLIRNLDKDAQKLKTSLSMIQSYMNDAGKKFIAQEEAVKTWLKELEDVVFDADNVLDELNYHLLSKKVKKLMSLTLKQKVLWFFSSFNHISRPSKMAHQIQEINITLESINKRATELGLESIVVNAPAAAPPNSAFETDSFTVDPIFIGRDDDVPLLVEKLTDRAEERKFSILSIVGMGGMGKPTLTRKVFSCTECEKIPALGHLPNLKSLFLYNLRNVECIESSFYGIENINIGDCINVFPALESLALSNMPKLREWAEVAESGPNGEEVKLFPHLQYLQINDCMQLTSAPSHFSSCLEELKIRRMNCPILLANIFGIKLESLTSLSIEGLEGLEYLPDWLFNNNRKLSKLEVGNCPKLRELPDGLHTLNSLEELFIGDCPNLKSIGQSRGSLTSLRSLKLLKCSELMDGFPYEMVESLAPSLQTLSLVGLKTGCLPRLLDCLTKPRSSSCSEILTFRSLRELEMDVSMEMESSSVANAIKETMDSILQGCSHSLTFLHLKGMDVWECLPESIQNLKALNRLKIENFGIEELPEWFGNLSSLESLTISNCNKLRHLPSVDAMQRLTRLRKLHIYGCPELCIDSEFLNISDLSIYGDYNLIEPPSKRIMLGESCPSCF